MILFIWQWDSILNIPFNVISMLFSLYAVFFSSQKPNIFKLQWKWPRLHHGIQTVNDRAAPTILFIPSQSLIMVHNLDIVAYKNCRLLSIGLKLTFYLFVYFFFFYSKNLSHSLTSHTYLRAYIIHVYLWRHTLTLIQPIHMI